MTILVGSLLSLSRYTRPDVSFAVHRASRQSRTPALQDYKLAKNIARYLKGAKGLKLHLHEYGEPQSPIMIVGFSDADSASENEDRKSMISGVQAVNEITIGWNCRKQAAVAQSTAIVDLVSVAVVGREALGLKEFDEELVKRVKTPVVLKIDNQAALKQIENEASSANTKHVNAKLKFLLDYFTCGDRIAWQ